MFLAYADEAVHIREVAPLTARDIARATGAGQSTVEAWLARTRAPSGTRAERLLELAAIVEQAARVLRPDAIPVWLHKPVASLQQDKPIDVIARGDYRRVADLLAGLETATFSQAWCRSTLPGHRDRDRAATRAPRRGHAGV